MKRKTRKYFKLLGIGLTLVLLTSLMVMAAPVAAVPVAVTTPAILRAGGQGAAVWSTDEIQDGTYSAKLSVTNGWGPDYGLVNIFFEGIRLEDLLSDPTFFANGIIDDGLGPYLNLLLDNPGQTPYDPTGTYNDALEGQVAVPFSSNYDPGWHLMEGAGFYDADNSLGQGPGNQDLADWKQATPNMLVVGVQILFGAMGDQPGVDGQTVYIDSVNFDGVTYDLEPRVINTTQTEGYNTIQAAIDAAIADDIIDVAAGTYNENVVVNKSLTLNGAKVGINAVTGTRGSSESTIDGGTTTAVSISASNVVLDGFTITIGIKDDASKQAGVIIANDASGLSNVTVKNNIIEDISDAGADSDTTGDSTYGILVWGTTNGPLDISIQNNVIQDVEEYGIAINDLSANVTINGNSITNMLAADPSGDGVGESFGVAIGIGGSDGASVVAVTNNTLNTGLTGYGLDATPAGVGIGIAFTGKVVTVTNNDITNNSEGIAVQSTATTMPVVHYNNISDNSVYGIHNYVTTASVDATNNWWGQSSGPDDPLTVTVDAEPWLLTVEGLTDESLRYDKTLALKPGWSIVSPDVELYSPTVVDPRVAYIIVDETVVYAYNAGVDSAWTETFTLDAISPVFIKTTAGGGIGFNYATDSMGIFTTNLEVGWNLIGVPKTDESVTTRAILSPLRYGQNDETALATLVSQGQYNPNGVSFYESMLGLLEWARGLPSLHEFDGYWVYMNVAKEFGVVVVGPGPQ